MAGADETGHPSPVAIVTSVGGLYVAQSVVGGITWTGLPAVMRNRGLPLDHIGLISLIAAPWALKFAWSPAVERFRLPRVGRNRSGIVVLLGGLVCVAGLVFAGVLGPAMLFALLACLTVVAFAAATVDIACDGYAVESLSRKDLGWGNAAQVGGAYLGSALGGGLFLVIVASGGWASGVWSMAALTVLLALPFMVLARRTAARSETRAHVPSIVFALKRPEIRRGLLAAALYVVAQKTALVMLGPFLIDAGLDLATIGLLNGLGSMVLGLTAALAGGALVRWMGIRPVLVAALLLQAAALLVFAMRDLYPGLPDAVLMMTAMASSSAILALGFVALYAQFMRWSDPRQGGVDFTLFQSMDALLSMIGGVVAGYAARYVGYAAFFIAAALVALAAVPAIALVVGRTDRGGGEPASPGNVPTGEESR